MLYMYGMIIKEMTCIFSSVKWTDSILYILGIFDVYFAQVLFKFEVGLKHMDGHKCLISD